MRSSAWIWRFLVHTQHHGALGRVQVEPDDVADLGHELRIAGELERLRRCGCSPNALQIRCTADCVRPTSAAIERVDQCVASLGVVSNVLVITSSTIASVIVRGCPGRGSSTRPSSRSASNRRRHFATVLRCTSRRAAISPLPQPVGDQQHDLRSLRKRLRGGPAPRPRLQLLALGLGELDRHDRRRWHAPPSPIAHELMRQDTRRTAAAAAQWLPCSAGSSSISRATARIQITVVMRKSTAPAITPIGRDRDADDRDREAGRVEDRQPARRRHVDLLADGRGVADALDLLHHAM